MNETGHLRKMAADLADPVRYDLRLDEAAFDLSASIGRRVELTYHGVIHCIHCGRKTAKSYNQGYCFPCSQRLAQCDMCIVRPHTCHYHEGTCREPAWGDAHCMQPHIVYLANSSGLKVGITRRTQIPTRWIDQGAAAALPIVAVTTRRIAGLIEVALAQHVSDKTDWRRMLRGAPEPCDLAARRDSLIDACDDELASIRSEFGADAFTVLESADPVALRYPVTRYPGKIRSLTLDKLPVVDSELIGIKGQYLIFEAGVLNVRRHAGYHVTWDG